MEEQRDRFCQMAFQPWVWVLALMVFALSIWAIVASGNNAGEDMAELQRQVQRSQTANSQVSGVPAAGQFMAMQQALTPLPIGARRFITPPHGERGRCHNCHPYTSTAATAAAAQAQTSDPAGWAVAQTQVPAAPRMDSTPQNFAPYPAGPPVLGIVPGSTTRVRSSGFLFPCWRRGVMVRQVYPGSFAQANGIQQGDVIIRFNGKKIRDTEHFQNLQSTLMPGTPVGMVICRDGRRIYIREVN
ncbi:MAG: PDZ domain-containing protein [bacterium]